MLIRCLCLSAITGLVEDALLLNAVGRTLANSRIWPNWGAGSEFKAARDQSSAERSGAAPAAAPPPPKGERGR